MKKIIFLANRIFPLYSGDALYNYGLCKEFSKYCKLIAISPLDEEFDMPCNEFEFHSLKHYHDNYDVEFKDLIKTISNKKKIDIVFISHIGMYKYYDVIKKCLPGVDIIYISHNVEIINLYQQYKSRTRSKVVLCLRLIKNWFKFVSLFISEYKLINAGTTCFTISYGDGILHKRIYRHIPEMIVAKPLIDFRQCKSQDYYNKFDKSMIIAGSMNWYPNIEGIEWFVKNVFPELAKFDYKLYLVGANPHKRIYELKNKYPNNIIVTGKVESMDPYYDIADISVIPLFSGTGAKIKVLESIGRGIPTVCTSFAAKDYNLRDEILIANSASEFIRSILSIQDDKELRKKIVEKMYDYYSSYMKLDEKIKRILE